MSSATPKRLRITLLLAGVIELAVGALHFAMPGQVYPGAGFERLGLHELEFVTLIVYAVGILLLAFGALTTWLALNLDHAMPILSGYLVIKVVLWSARTALEVMYPVELRMFGVEPFTALVFPGVVFELSLFILAAFWARQLSASART